jgi:16S rRNA (guanine966-N2)-methyltransferase
MRITGGVWRSRSLRAPRGTATRPTSDRVREALFSILASEGLVGGGASPRVLDLYAGTGALALEALSRGAAGAVLVEQGKDALAAIRDNVRALGAERSARVVASRVEAALARSFKDAEFDLVFCDPPYADVRRPGFDDVLAGVARVLAPGGALVLEHASSDPPPAVPGLSLERSRTYGDTALSLYRLGAAV